jgi:hypothetical protein
VAKPTAFHDWDYAAEIDRTLKIGTRHERQLTQKQITAVHYSRNRLFTSMAHGEPVIFHNLEVPLRREGLRDDPTAIADSFSTELGEATKVRVRTGPSQRICKLTAPELIRRWNGGKATVSVTDLQIRRTRIMKLIDTAPLSDFNLLPISRHRAIQGLELLTLVVSSAGSLTDSHTDDPDGSNRCFSGRKLWLIWDEISGLARGLENVERCNVYDRAAFDSSTFLSLSSSRWFVLSKGQTLFLPGSYAHKVITLERYLGVGSFFVMLPHYLRTLLRWKRLTPLWTLNDSTGDLVGLLDDITRFVTDYVKTLMYQPSHVRRFWGLGHLVRAVRNWETTCLPEEKRLLTDSPSSAEFLKAVQGLG